MYDYNKDAKIIMIFREPSSFLYSAYKHYFSSFKEIEKDFEKALSLEQSRKKGYNLYKRINYPSNLFYSEKLKYATQLKRYLQYFPPKNIKVILYENFKNNNRKTLNEIFDFLKIKKVKINISQIINVTKNKEIKYDIIRWLKRVYTDPYNNTFVYRILCKIIPKNLRIKLIHLLIQLSKPKKTDKLSDKLKKKIKKDCYDEIKEFNRLLKEHNLSDEDVMKKWNITLDN
ncbi:MAG: sulfotransferase domain-containing protein [Bacillota bacterium]